MRSDKQNVYLIKVAKFVEIKNIMAKLNMESLGLFSLKILGIAKGYISGGNRNISCSVKSCLQFFSNIICLERNS